jgi:hypothetical protein
MRVPQVLETHFNREIDESAWQKQKMLVVGDHKWTPERDGRPLQHCQLASSLACTNTHLLLFNR